MLDEKSRIEIALNHLGRQVVQNPALRGALCNGAQHRGKIQPGLISVQQALAHADDRAREHNLIAHLRVLAIAGSALVDDVLAHGLEQRHHFVDAVFVAADHDRQGGVLRAHIAARHRRVDGGYALRAGRVVDLARQAWLGGRHVDGDRAAPRRLKNAVFLEVNRAHIARQADDGKHHVGCRRDVGRRIGPLRALVEQALRLRFRSTVDGHGEALRL